MIVFNSKFAHCTFLNIFNTNWIAIQSMQRRYLVAKATQEELGPKRDTPLLDTVKIHRYAHYDYIQSVGETCIERTFRRLQNEPEA